MSQSEASSSRRPSYASSSSKQQDVSYEDDNLSGPLSPPSHPPPTRPRNRTGILSRGPSNRSTSHVPSPDPSLVYPSASEDDGDGDIITDSGPLPRRFPSSNPTSARSSSSLQSQYRSLSQSYVPQPFSRVSPLASAASSSSNLVLTASQGNHHTPGAQGTSSHDSDSGGRDVVFDLNRAKSISSVSSVTSTSSMEATPFRAAPLGKIRMSYSGAAAMSSTNRNQGLALHIDPSHSHSSHSDWAIGIPGTTSTPPSPDAGGLGASLETAQHTAIAAAAQDFLDSGGSPSFETSEKLLGGSAELPRRTADHTVKVVSSPAAALAARQKGYLPKATSNEWLYRNGPGMGSHLGGKPLPGAYRSLAEMTQGTSDNAVGASNPPLPSPTSKRTAAVIRNKLAKSASKLGLKPLTVVPGATPSHPRIAAEFADSASTTSETLDVQQDLISSATGAALSDPRAINARPRSVGGSPALFNVELMARTSSATNAPLVVPRLSPHPDAVQRMTAVGGFFPGSAPTNELTSMVKGSSTSGSALKPAHADDDFLPPILNLNSLFHRPGSRASIGRPASNQRPSSSLSSSGLANTDALNTKTLPAAIPAPDHPHTTPQPTPAEVVRMEAQAGIARLPTVGSGPTPGPTPTLWSSSFSSPQSTPSQPHSYPSKFESSTTASLPPSTIWRNSRKDSSSDGNEERSSTSSSRPAMVRSSASESKALLIKDHLPETLRVWDDIGGDAQISDSSGQRNVPAGTDSLHDFMWNGHVTDPNNSTGREQQKKISHRESLAAASPHLLTSRDGDHDFRPSFPDRSRNSSLSGVDDGSKLGTEALGAFQLEGMKPGVVENGFDQPVNDPFSARDTMLLSPSGKRNQNHEADPLRAPLSYVQALASRPTPAPMLRMESANTAISKAVSDTSDLVPPAPFKKPGRVVAGKVSSSELQYDGIDGDVIDTSSDAEIAEETSNREALSAPPSVGIADRLSIIAETSPDRRSSRTSRSSVEKSVEPDAESGGMKATPSPSNFINSAPDNSFMATTALPKQRGRDDFEFGDILGEGSYSTVILAWDLLTNSTAASTSRPKAVTSVASALSGSGSKSHPSLREGKRAYAIKVLDKVHILKERKQKYVAVEKEALSLLVRQAGIIKLYWTFQDQESLYFVLELAPNGELLTFIKKYGSFDEATTRYYAAQLLDAIAGMHKLGVIHRDVKPENVLLDDKMRVKVTDFGSAKIVKDANRDGLSGSATPSSSRTNSFVGTAEYVSPELLTDKSASEASDFWAFGCVVFQMLAGRPPFKASSEYQTFQKIIKRDFEMPSELTEEAKDLLDHLLVLEPDQRLREEQIRSHPYFVGVDWGSVWNTPAPAIKSGIRPAPPPKAVREEDLNSLLDDFGNHNWVNDQDSPFDEAASRAATEEELVEPSLQAHVDGSSNEEAASGEHSKVRSADLISLQSGHRADGEEDESDSSSHSHSEIQRSPAPPPRFHRLSAPPQRVASPALRPGTAVLNWAALLLPHEAVLYASPTIHRRTGTANLQSKKRMLILTDFPRLLCVKEDAHSLKVKSEVLLKMPGDETSHRSSQRQPAENAVAPPSRSSPLTGSTMCSSSYASSSPSARRGSISGTPSTVYLINGPTSSTSLQNTNPHVLLSIEQRGMKTLVVHTFARSYTYDDPSGDATNWIRSIRSAADRR